MRLDTSQHMHLSQEMRLSPRIIQAMEILQLSTVALLERLDAELQSNPVLEIEENTDSSEADVLDDVDRGEEDMIITDGGNNSDDFERLDMMTREYGEEFVGESMPLASRRQSSGEADPKMEAMANTPDRTDTLRDDLHNQWMFVEMSDEIREAGKIIIDAIDDDGYLRTSLEELSGISEPPVDPEAMRTALDLIQELEPVGVGARDLRECLMLQLAAFAEEGRDVALEMQLVVSFLREIEMNHLPQISKRTGRSIEDIKKAIENISHLDPHPGLLVGGPSAPVIHPDVIVELSDEGHVMVIVSDDHLPHLAVSDYYVEQSRDRAQDVSTRKFLKKNIRSGRWLIEAVAQRRRTLRRVTEEVFVVQRDFLDEGREALRPLPMADIAEKVGVHVATVSRAVADKYVQTPQGIFPLRMFFSGGTNPHGMPIPTCSARERGRYWVRTRT